MPSPFYAIMTILFGLDRKHNCSLGHIAPKSSASNQRQSEMNLPFKKGEKVVYPAHGVAVIEDIQSKVISGSERRFYMLRILGTEKMTIMIPTENVEAVGLRRVIGKDMVTKIYKILRERKVKADSQTGNP